MVSGDKFVPTDGTTTTPLFSVDNVAIRREKRRMLVH